MIKIIAIFPNSDLLSKKMLTQEKTSKLERIEAIKMLKVKTDSILLINISKLNKQKYKFSIIRQVSDLPFKIAKIIGLPLKSWNESD